MSDGSKIEWTDATWQPITGCSVVSPGCTNCYAMGLAGTRLRHHPSRAGLTRASKAGPVWTGEVRLNEQWLTQPLAWTRPRRVFVCAHGDLFHESVPDSWIDRVFAVMALAPHHTFQVLTKRSTRMRVYLGRPDRVFEVAAAAQESPALQSVIKGLPTNTIGALPLPNVWLGVSAERQAEADARVPDLLATPAAVRFVSAEPLLGPVDFTNIKCPDCGPSHIFHRADGTMDALDGVPRLDWVIVGGESGPDARPMHPDWARDLRDQCTDAGVPFFFKQWGAWEDHGPAWGTAACDDHRATRGWLYLDTDGTVHRRRETSARCARAMHHVGKKAAGRLLDGREWSEMPAAVTSTKPASVDTSSRHVDGENTTEPTGAA